MGQAQVVLPTSDTSNVTGGTDYAPTVTTVWPADPCKNGWTFLGDLSKYVAASSNRFGHVSCDAGKLSVTVYGTAAEKVAVAFLQSSPSSSSSSSTAAAAATVHVMDVTVPPSGSITLSK